MMFTVGGVGGGPAHTAAPAPARCGQAGEEGKAPHCTASLGAVGKREADQ